MKSMHLIVAVALCAAGGVAQSQNYPTKPVRIIVPFPPGGGSDYIARLIAPPLTKVFGQQFIVDNRGGAGSTLGTEVAFKSPADGYTLLLISGSFTTSPSLYKNLKYDPLNDMVPVIQTEDGPYVITIHPSLPVKTVKQLVALARSKPGNINYASTGQGGITHLATELFRMMAGVNITHIPYKGTGPALTDVLGGQVQILFGSAPATVPHVRTGKLRGLGVTTPKRIAALPDMPTISEAGVPGYEVVLWYGVLGPKGLPKDIVARWNSEIKRIIQTQEMKGRFANEGLTPAPGTPGDFAKVLKRDIEKWMKVVKDANVKAQ